MEKQMIMTKRSKLYFLRKTYGKILFRTLREEIRKGIDPEIIEEVLKIYKTLNA